MSFVEKCENEIGRFYLGEQKVVVVVKQEACAECLWFCPMYVCVLVLAGIELPFFIGAGVVLYFGFRVK